MKSWKTTTGAVIGIVAGFVAFSPQWFHPFVVDVAKYVMVGGLAAIGILGKDADVHSTYPEVREATDKVEDAKIGAMDR